MKTYVTSQNISKQTQKNVGENVCDDTKRNSDVLPSKHQDGRVVKALDLSFNVRLHAWVRTPLLVISKFFIATTRMRPKYARA